MFCRYLCISTLFFAIFTHAFELDMPVSYLQVVDMDVKQVPTKLLYGDDKDQFIEYWPPSRSGMDNTGKAAESRTPSALKTNLVFIHGGCWLPAYDIAHSRAFTQALAQQGYPVYSIEYRRGESDNQSAWQRSYQDIAAAIAKLQTEVFDTGSHPANNGFVLLGHSAGGHLALISAVKAQQMFPERIKHLQAVIGLAAISDIESYAQGENSCQSVTKDFMGGMPDALPETYQRMNPRAYPVFEPTYLVHGRADKIVPLAQSENYPVDKVWIENAGHFDLIHPHTAAFKRLLALLESL